MSLMKRRFGKIQLAPARLPLLKGERVRVGLTGLAAVFLLVLAVAAGVRPTRTVAGTPGEPLAVLGVAPGAGNIAPR